MTEQPAVAGTDSTGRLTAVVTVGTDHHRFDRLMDWLESWQDTHPGAIEWIVQHGASRPMRGTTGFALKPRPELLEVLRTADLVITQGGPGGIMDARECGKLPIVVPRLARLDEVVDDHQVAFARQLSATGMAITAQTERELHAALDRALANPADFLATGEASDVAGSVARLEAVVDQLLLRRPSRRLRAAGRR